MPSAGERFTDIGISVGTVNGRLRMIDAQDESKPVHSRASTPSLGRPTTPTPGAQTGDGLVALRADIDYTFSRMRVRGPIATPMSYLDWRAFTMHRAMRATSTSLPPDQKQALHTFARFLVERGDPPQRLILVDAEGQQAEVPPATVAALAPAMAAVTAGLDDTSDPALLPDDAELTTTEAARFLRISRQYLARLVDRSVLPYRMVGSHHRLRVSDLRAYQARQRAAIREAAQLSEELGLYDD